MKISFLESGLPHIQVPSDVPPKYLISIRNKRVFFRGLDFFSALTPGNKLKKALLGKSYSFLRTIVRSGLIGNANDGKLEQLRDFLVTHVQESSICNVYLPSYRKAVIQVVNPTGKCEKVLKVAFDVSEGNALLRERDNLRTMERFAFETFELPAVLNSGSYGDVFFVEYSCPEEYRPYERLGTSPELLHLLTELFLAGKKPDVPITEAPVFTVVSERVRAVDDLEIREFFVHELDQCTENLRPVRLPLGIVHYDLKPWNMLVNLKTKKLFIVDWELMQTNGFPLWDAYCYVLFTHFTMHGIDQPEEVLRQFRKHGNFFGRYAEALNFDKKLVEQLLPLFFLDLLTIGELWNRWEKGENRPKRVFDDMKEFLTYLSKH